MELDAPTLKLLWRFDVCDFVSPCVFPPAMEPSELGQSKMTALHLCHGGQKTAMRNIVDATWCLDGLLESHNELGIEHELTEAR